MVRLWQKPLLKPMDVFTKEELDGIQKATEEAELLTSGEIKVAIRSDCRQGLSAKEQALEDFYRLGLDKTRDKTGVLILIVLHQRAAEVLADKGINDKVPDGYWNETVETIASGFREGKAYEGVREAVVKIGQLLEKNFPRKPEDVDEVSGEVSLGE